MEQRPFRRLAIINRGEAAMRAIRAVRELNWERDESITIIAFYTEDERHALFVRQSDERYGLDGGYLDYEALERALVESRADAAWVGWGFVAEHPEFAELCERLGIVFVGPDPDVMRALGDKIEGKRLAEQADVPVAAWSGGAVETVEDAVRQGEQLGFPVMIKAAAGGGGRGMRRVEHADELENAFQRAREEAEKSFGDSRVLMESLVGAARHVEVQLIADGDGARVGAGGPRLQLSAPPSEGRRGVGQPCADRRAGARAGRVGGPAGQARRIPRRRHRRVSVRALRGRFSFMEVNTRLQVEHPVTEMVTGVDLVKLQLHVAAGGRLEGEPPPPNGHAIEARLNAEDPGLGFAPTPDGSRCCGCRAGPGVRVDSGVAEGDSGARGVRLDDRQDHRPRPHREEAIARLRRAIADTMVVIEEGTTNQGFLLELLGRPELRDGEVDTGWLDRLQGQGEVQSKRHADVALVRAAIELCDAATATERAVSTRSPGAAGPRPSADVRRAVDLRYQGASYRFAVSQIGPQRYVLDDRRQPDRGRARTRLRARAADLVRRRRLPDADGAAGRRPAGRGRRRPSSDLAATRAG